MQRIQSDGANLFCSEYFSVFSNINRLSVAVSCKKEYISWCSVIQFLVKVSSKYLSFIVFDSVKNYKVSSVAIDFFLTLTFCLTHHLSVPSSVCLSVCLSGCLSIHISVCLNFSFTVTYETCIL